MEGEIFKRLKVLSHLPKENKNHSYFLCLCDCGNKIEARGSHLLNGQIKSCGCLSRETASRNLKKYIKSGKHNGIGNPAYKHGMTNTRLFHIYQSLRQRCENKNAANYYNYGGKGITQPWNTFDIFYKDMGISYAVHTKKYGEKSTSIDRIDNSKSYSKENCRWATPEVQSRNKSTNRFLLYKGVSLCYSDWDKKLKLPIGTVAERIKAGWTVERTISTPLRKW